MFALRSRVAVIRSFCSKWGPVVSQGELGEPLVRFVDDDGRSLSPWHDLPLYHSEALDAVNMVLEMPRGATRKMEISHNHPLNPIVQDKKNGALRFITYQDSEQIGLPWHYGALPRTWENPSVVDTRSGLPGDDDPLDVIDLFSPEACGLGAVYPVVPVGALALVDEGETDWKILAVSLLHPGARDMRSLVDIENEFPGLVERIRQWYTLYKTVDGKPPNSFAGDALDQASTYDLIAECHQAWKSRKWF